MDAVKQEHVLLFALAFLAVIILWEMKRAPVVVDNPADNNNTGDPTLSIVPTPANTAEGPSYLTYNQPYAFASHLVHTVSKLTQGQVGQVGKDQSFFTQCEGDCS